MSLLTGKPHPSLHLYIRQFSSSVFDVHLRKAYFPEGSFRFPDSAIRVVFHFSDTIPWFEVNGKTFSQPRQNVRGLQLKPVIFNSRQSINVFSIEFTPAGFMHFFNLPCSELELTPQYVHSSWFPDYQYLFEKLSLFQHFSDRINFLNSYFLGKLRSHPDQKKIAQLHRLISDHSLTPTVKQLAEATFTTERSLGRFFNRYFGVSPKLYIRLCRFEKIVAAINNQRGLCKLTDIALEFGFYDQAHFINDFKAFTGISPTKMNNHLF